MARTRREFTPEFKREAVALLESSGRPQMQVAAELGYRSEAAFNRAFTRTVGRSPGQVRRSARTG